MNQNLASHQLRKRTIKAPRRFINLEEVKDPNKDHLVLTIEKCYFKMPNKMPDWLTQMVLTHNKKLMMSILG
jgi:hypothetical protein